MTELLQKAFEKAAQLSQDEQDEFAHLMLGELESDERWKKLFGSPESEDLLERMADETLEEHRAGEAGA